MNSEELIRLAKASISARRIEEAVDFCQQVLESEPTNRDALHMLALARSSQGDVSEALDLLERAIGAAPEYAPAYNDFGALQLSAERPDQALEPLRRAVALNPEFVDAYINLGNVFQRLGRYADAEENYRQGLAIDSGHARGWVSLGNLLRTRREFEEAVQCFDKALELQPGNPVIHNFLGVAYRNLGEIERAKGEFQQALACDPNLPLANANFGGVLMAQGEFRDAIPYLDKGGNDRSSGNAIECLLRLGEHEELLARVATLAGSEHVNLYVAAMSAYVSERLGLSDPYPYCPNPLDFVRITDRPGGSEVNDQFIGDLIRECLSQETVYEPIGVTTRKGFQSPMSIFQEPQAATAKLRRLIDGEIEKYREEYHDRHASLLSAWPERTAVRGWFVRLLRDGHQRAHNHTDAWLSGCFYLQIPDQIDGDEGSIEFRLDGPGYPEIGQGGRNFLHRPRAGDLALFPSSLFHRTIPFGSDEERLCIAFDVIPVV